MPKLANSTKMYPHLFHCRKVSLLPTETEPVQSIERISEKRLLMTALTITVVKVIMPM